ncbi:Major facilitator superfamily MFS_1 [Candidatus Accumulibacter aalborgensis]|uniref:Major facilitator superfamily MFS_1 n=2 Tax=Candidatus Accumulibacter aalborgensis TaxID=1860102 RepID=A0A1A8XFZ4_9PROT|nr:Major facilitator superfamily MFS_1 [Candidatus Accumulibacter aalborgensis]
MSGDNVLVGEKPLDYGYQPRNIAMTNATRPLPKTHDLEVISLIGFVHGVSHFFHLLLPPLFPWLMKDFGLSFTGIGATMTIFFIVSAIGQALAGFLVDRYGAARVVGGGIGCFLVAALLLSVAEGYAGLAVVAALAGLGNSVFHPADFTVLNRHVSPPRLSYAFSIHGLSGNLGWALAPVFMTGIAAAAGWRVAALAAAGVAVLALALLFWRYRTLADPPGNVHASDSGQAVSVFAFLRSTAVWLCFAFFFLITTAFGAIQNFATPILQNLYGLSLAAGATALSAYLLGGAGGILTGGFLARKGDQERLIAGALGAGAILAVALATLPLPASAVLPLMVCIGYCTGIAGPSRDLLVRRAATSRFGQAAYGRVYGFVYSGLDAGLALAPLAFGGLMDSGRFAAVLVGIAVLQGLAILTAFRVGGVTGQAVA